MMTAIQPACWWWNISI